MLSVIVPTLRGVDTENRTLVPNLYGLHVQSGTYDELSGLDGSKLSYYESTIK